MGSPPGLENRPPPVGGYQSGDVVFVNPPSPAPYWQLTCATNNSDPVWVFFGID